MKSHKELKKENQLKLLGKLNDLMIKLEGKGYTVAEVIKKSNIEGSRLYDLLSRGDNPRGLSKVGEIIAKIEPLLEIDLKDLDIDTYKSLYSKIEEIEKTQVRILETQNKILNILKK